MRILTLGLLMFSLLLSGCGTVLRGTPEKPEVSLAGIKLLEVGLLEQQFLIQLRVHNPNNFDIPVDGLDVNLDLNGQSFARALSATRVVLPKYGSTVVDVKAVSTLSTLTGQVGQLITGGKGSLQYKLHGKIHLVEPVISFPVLKEGEFRFQDLLK